MKNMKIAKKGTRQPVASVAFCIIRKEKMLSAGILLLVLLAVAASLIPPLILGKIIDRIADGAGGNGIWIAEYMGILVLTGVLESGRESFLNAFGQKITHALRSELAEKVGRLDADILEKEDPGQMVSRFVGDVDTVEALFTSGIISMFADACRIVSIFLMICAKNTGLAMLLLIVLPGIFFFTRLVQKRMLFWQKKTRAVYAKINAYVPETIACIRTIHVLRKEDYMEKRYDAALEEGFRSMEGNNFYDAVYSPIILICNALMVAAVMLSASSGNQRILGFFGMSVGTSVTVIDYLSRIFSPVENLGMEIQTIQSAMAGVCRINDFLNLPEREKTSEDAKKAADKTCTTGEKTGFVDLTDVSFAYDPSGSPQILKNLNLSVKTGEQVTLTGRTGAGKSTIFKLILGLYLPDSGKVLVDKKEAYRIPDEKRRKTYGYVEQKFHMVSGTVKDQITLFDERITEDAVLHAARIVGLHDTIMTFKDGYHTVCHPQLFSQGQWQLLSIARAIAGEPKLLLLDEITANLDAKTEKDILEAIRRAADGRTVIGISHRTLAGGDREIIIGTGQTA